MDVLAVVADFSATGRRDFAGRPLALHALEKARAARRVVRVCLVTADADVALLATDAGADVVAPPPDAKPVEYQAAVPFPILRKEAAELLGVK